MELEWRYIAIKLSDANAALNESLAYALGKICRTCEGHRKARGAKPLEGLFIEKDWPEYPVAARMLLNRINGEEFNRSPKMSIAEDALGSWLNAALSDNTICDGFRNDILAWLAEIDAREAPNGG